MSIANYTVSQWDLIKICAALKQKLKREPTKAELEAEVARVKTKWLAWIGGKQGEMKL